MSPGSLLTIPNSRSYLNHFTQPDSIVPEQIQGVQAWDRYAYSNNNPVRYNDPTGHCIGFSNCFIEIAMTSMFLGTRLLKNGRLIDKDFRDAANYAAPARVSGSKESISGFVSEFVTGVAGVSLVTTADGQSQFFVEKGVGGSLPGIGLSASHGEVYGLDYYDAEVGSVQYDPLRYRDEATQGNLSIPLPFCEGACGPYFEAYQSDDGQVWGIDMGFELGATPTILGAAHTNAEPRENITFVIDIPMHFLNKELNGRELLGCRLLSMCGAR